MDATKESELDECRPTGNPKKKQSNQFALAVYYTLLMFLRPKPDNFFFRTRAYSEKVSKAVERYLTTIELEIDDIENGSKFLGWQTYHAWVAGMAGLPVGLVLTAVTVSAPFFTANVSTAGVTITPSSPTN